MKEKIKHHALTIDNDYIQSELEKSVDFTNSLDVMDLREKEALLKKAIENNCSYRETAEWLSHHTGRKLTGMGLREVLKRVIHKGW